MDYEFEWDIVKAKANAGKHGIVFLEAMTIFVDPLAMTRYDDEHSEDEERWVSLGRSKNGRLLLVVHTFDSTGSSTARSLSDLIRRARRTAAGCSARRGTRRCAIHNQRLATRTAN